jgi:hypothetical protein
VSVHQRAPLQRFLLLHLLHHTLQLAHQHAVGRSVSGCRSLSSTTRTPISLVLRSSPFIPFLVRVCASRMARRPRRDFYIIMNALEGSGLTRADDPIARGLTHHVCQTLHARSRSRSNTQRTHPGDARGTSRARRRCAHERGRLRSGRTRARCGAEPQCLNGRAECSLENWGR